ncbi:MAG: alkaline phosphatase D family protein [Aquisalinus sp.]|nr:alkaline phosphatase D family protein [Aquisalinus sp.]
MVKVSRREALLGTAALGAAGCANEYKHESFTSPAGAAEGVFQHGVASGDPTSTSIVLWTRATPEDETASSAIPVTLELARDEDFTTERQTLELSASAATDWTVKHNATGLTSGSTYYYRFSVNGSASPVGRSKTLPAASIDEARFAVTSCSNWQHGFFNAYDHIARNKTLDAVIHLGDYFYEYGIDGYGSETAQKLGRLHEPAHEVLTLTDYRQRHAQYKSDAALQALHAAHPTIHIWDDHEVANNSWEGGAENHQLDEGDWLERRRVAMQAYYEWMPVRDPEPGKPLEALYRSYSWGDLLTLVSIETRLTARAEQIDIDAYSPDFRSQEDVDDFMTNIVGAENRYLLGDTQLDFIVDALTTSKEKGQTWRLMANQILLADVRSPDLTPYASEEMMLAIEPAWAGIRDFVRNSAFGLPLYIDTWGGYPFARERFYDRLAENGINDLVVLTGDAHEFWANDLYTDGKQKMGVELGTTSITSETVEAFLGDGTKDFALLITKDNDCVRYYDPQHHGYIDLTVTKDRIHADLIGLDTVESRDYTAFVTAAFDIKKKRNTVEFKNPRGLGPAERFLY